MTSFAARFLILIVAILGAGAAHAQNPAPPHCTDDVTAVAVGDLILACTRVIESGGFMGPDLAETYRRRGMAYLRNGQPNEALADFEQAAAIDPASPRILADRGCALLRLSRDADAEASFAAAAGIDARFDADAARAACP